MSILTKKEFLENIKNGQLAFNPALDEFQLQEHAVDLRLGFTFLVPKIWRLTEKGREVTKSDEEEKINAPKFDVVELEEGQYFELMPGEYVLASTLEKISLGNKLVANLFPRSSINRRGVSLDLSGLINANYEGQLILPIRNNTSSQIIKLYPGERICQITLSELKEPVSAGKSKYHKEDIANGYKKDGSKEMELLKKGKLRELKERYSLK